MITDPSGKTSLSGKNIVSILEDKEGAVWIGTDDGGLNCYFETPAISRIISIMKKRCLICGYFFDSKNRIWVGQKGLYLFRSDPESFPFIHR